MNKVEKRPSTTKETSKGDQYLSPKLSRNPVQLLVRLPKPLPKERPFLVDQEEPCLDTDLPIFVGVHRRPNMARIIVTTTATTSTRTTAALTAAGTQGMSLAATGTAIVREGDTADAMTDPRPHLAAVAAMGDAERTIDHRTTIDRTAAILDSAQGHLHHRHTGMLHLVATPLRMIVTTEVEKETGMAVEAVVVVTGDITPHLPLAIL